MNEKKEKPKSIEPEVIDNEEKKQPLLPSSERVKEDKITIASKPRKFSFLNRFEKKRIESFTEVVRAETEFLGALGEHARTRGRLRDIDIEVETDHLERLNKLREAQRKFKLQDGYDEIAELDIKAQIKELEKKLAGAKKRRKKEGRFKKLKRQLRETLIKQKIQDEYDIDDLIRRIRKELNTQQAIDQVFKEVYNEHFQGKTEEQYKKEDWETDARFEDLYKRVSVQRDI